MCSGMMYRVELLSDRNKILNDEQTNNRINPESKSIMKKLFIS